MAFLAPALFFRFPLAMSKPTLFTDFVKIAQSGPTIDGRIIEPQWLIDMAESYDKNTYTALLWPEHNHSGNNWGYVDEVKAEHNGAVVELYARLAPNASFHWERQYGQKLFYSVEIDFTDDGKAYLSGLAATDTPASFGLPLHQFNQVQGQPGQKLFFSIPNPNAPQNAGGKPTPQALTKEVGLLRQAFDKFSNIFQHFNDEDTLKMTPEEIKALIDETIAALEARLAAVEGKIADAEKAATDAAAAAEAAEEAAEAVAEVVGEDLEEFSEEGEDEEDKEKESKKHSALAKIRKYAKGGKPGKGKSSSSELQKVLSSLGSLNSRLDAMDKKFSQAAPGTSAPENTGGKDEFEPLY